MPAVIAGGAAGHTAEDPSEISGAFKAADGGGLLDRKVRIVHQQLSGQMDSRAVLVFDGRHLRWPLHRPSRPSKQPVRPHMKRPVRKSSMPPAEIKKGAAKATSHKDV